RARTLAASGEIMRLSGKSETRVASSREKWLLLTQYADLKQSRGCISFACEKGRRNQGEMPVKAETRPRWRIQDPPLGLSGNQIHSANQVTSSPAPRRCPKTQS